MMRLAGRVAIVTDGAAGIGRETALRFAAEGARVIVWDVGGASPDGGIGYRRADVTSTDDVRAATAEVLAACGQIDIFVSR